MGMVAIHVDDILYAGTKSFAKVVVEALGDSLPTKNLGEVKFFLGCAFIRGREACTIEISQESYIRSVLERLNICRTSPIPASLPTSRMLCGRWRGTLTSQRRATGRRPRRF